MSLKAKVEQYFNLLTPLVEDKIHASDAVLSRIIPVFENYLKGDDSELYKIYAFLMIKPMFFRSGYLKEEICHKLKKRDFSNQEKELLQQIVLDQIPYAGREFRGYASLAPKITSEAFLQKIQAYDDKGIAYIHKRKMYLIALLK